MDLLCEDNINKILINLLKLWNKNSFNKEIGHDKNKEDLDAQIENIIDVNYVNQNETNSKKIFLIHKVKKRQKQILKSNLVY